MLKRSQYRSPQLRILVFSLILINVFRDSIMWKVVHTLQSPEYVVHTTAMSDFYRLFHSHLAQAVREGSSYRPTSVI
jgi:hypothetical protein